MTNRFLGNAMATGPVLQHVQIGTNLNAFGPAEGKVDKKEQTCRSRNWTYKTDITNGYAITTIHDKDDVVSP